jgi:CheY-like chemotaxis protein
MVSPVRAKPLQGVRVLLVEDNPDHMEMAEAFLRQFGATIYAAHTAQEALDGYFAFLPDVIVSDLRMPGADGYSFVSCIRDRGHKVPAIAVSGYAGPEHRAKSREAGFNLHVAKPLLPNALLDAIRSLLPQ